MRFRIAIMTIGLLSTSAAFADDSLPITFTGPEAQALYDILTKPALEQIQPDGSRTPLVVFDPRQLATLVKEKMAAAQIQKNMPPAASASVTPPATPATP